MYLTFKYQEKQSHRLNFKIRDKNCFSVFKSKNIRYDRLYLVCGGRGILSMSVLGVQILSTMKRNKESHLISLPGQKSVNERQASIKGGAWAISPESRGSVDNPESSTYHLSLRPHRLPPSVGAR